MYVYMCICRCNSKLLMMVSSIAGVGLVSEHAGLMIIHVILGKLDGGVTRHDISIVMAYVT